MNSVTGYDIYRQYLAFKLHFSNPKFDFFESNGKTNAKETTYQQRNDFWFFEILSKKLNDNEVNEYLLASFVSSETPQKVWIGDIKTEGKEKWLKWQGRQASLPYIFTQDIERLKENDFNSWFDTSKGHPYLLKTFIRDRISLESLIILDIIIPFMLYWDRDLKDPLWQTLSFKIKKYKPFLSINKDKYKKILKDIILY